MEAFLFQNLQFGIEKLNYYRYIYLLFFKKIRIVYETMGFSVRRFQRVWRCCFS